MCWFLAFSVHGFARVIAACQISWTMLSITIIRLHVYNCIEKDEKKWPSLTFLAWPSVTFRVRRNSERLMKETPDRPKQKLGKKAASSANLLTRSPSLERCDDVELSYEITIALCHCVRSVPDLNSFPLIWILGSVGVSGTQLSNCEVVWVCLEVHSIVVMGMSWFINVVPTTIFVFIVSVNCSVNFVWGAVLSARFFTVDFVSVPFTAEQKISYPAQVTILPLFPNRMISFVSSTFISVLQFP